MRRLWLLPLFLVACIGPWNPDWNSPTSADDDDVATDDDDTTDDDDATDDDDDVPETETNCDDDADNDRDTLFDCDDPDCFEDPACQGDDDDATDDDDAADPDGDMDGYPASVDCNDENSAINPGQFEICDDGIDQNCNDDADCDDSQCEQLPLCVTEDAYEPNDSPATALDISNWPSGSFTGIVCPGNDDWYTICLGQPGDFSATVTTYNALDLSGPPLDDTTWTGSTTPGFDFSSHTFGVTTNGQDCDGYSVVFTINGPGNGCP